LAHLIFCVLTTALIAGCGSSDGSTADSNASLPDELIIGAAISKTGYLAPYDANIAAIKQLAEETNAEDGIDGRKIRFVEADNHSDPQQAPRAAQEVIEAGADVLLYSCEAPVAAAGAPVAEENNLLNFTLCASEPGYGPPYTGRLSFTANRSLISEAAARATFLHEKGLERPFLLRDTSTILGKVDCFGFEETWKNLGGEIAGSADFKNSDESISSQISELKASEADAINICSYPPGGAAAIKQIRAAGIDAPITVDSAFDGTFWTSGIPSTAGIYTTLNGSAYDPTDEKTAKFYDDLEKAGVDTDVSGAMLATYAAGELILQAIDETGTTDGNALANALEAKPHETIMGKIAYSSDSHLPVGPWFIYEYSSGKPKLVKKVSPEFFPAYEG
jgi:branched-chain amino acid transport system substrate-binding protein